MRDLLIACMVYWQSRGFIKHHYTVLGPYQGQVKASFLYNEQQSEAIVEMAQCSGIELNLNHRRQGEKATTMVLVSSLDIS